jgi:hypothetical protein
MKQKPLIYILISIFCVIEPLVKLFYFRITTDFKFDVIFSNVFARTGFFEIFDFWLVFPLTGLTLLKIRKWTYFAFMSFLIYIIYSILTYEKYTWPYYSESPFLYHYVLVGLCCVGFIYFLFPEVRQPFFDRTIRWWENKRRFHVNIPCEVKLGSAVYATTIMNLSQTGAFLKGTPELQDLKAADLTFTYGDLKLLLPMTLISHHNYNNVPGIGVKFEFKNWGSKLQAARLMKKVKKAAWPPNR